MKKSIYYLLLFLTTVSCNNTKTQPVINVAVAANMQYAMDELVDKFESQHPITIETSSSSSGILTAQIINGAPFDIFISANMKYPNKLFEEGFTVTPPKTYAYGVLILWSLDEGIDLNAGMTSLLSTDVSTIAIANTETAPYGIAALEALQNTELYDTLNSKLVIGESIGQVNQYIQSQSVNAGITSKSVLYSANILTKGKSIQIDKSLYSPINQGIVMLKNKGREKLKNAQLFYDFMLSKEAATILTKYGYEVD